MKKKVTILGAGLAGLSCADRLNNEGIDVTILEKEKFVGGLAASHTRGGFFYDFGPHRFHSDKEHVIRFFRDLLKDNIVSVKRRSQIYDVKMIGSLSEKEFGGGSGNEEGCEGKYESEWRP
jgi:protoporphyrinogen oxidase